MQLETPGLQFETPGLSPRRKRHRAVALVAVMVAFISSAAFWLATSGSGGPTITGTQGVGPSGEVAEVISMSSSVQRSIGNANLQTGKAIAKLLIAKNFTDKIRVIVGWINANDAGRVLNNPNVQVSVGLYHPIHTGSCTTGTPTGQVAELVSITEPTTSQVFCGALDGAVEGTPQVSPEGKLLLHRTAIAGYFLSAATAEASPATCASTTVDSDGSTDSVSEQSDRWCQPTTGQVTGVGAEERLMYVVASIITPGGSPQGQANTTDGLEFYVRIRRALS